MAAVCHVGFQNSSKSGWEDQYITVPNLIKIGQTACRIITFTYFRDDSCTPYSIFKFKFLTAAKVQKANMCYHTKILSK